MMHLKNYKIFEEEKISILSLVCLVKSIPFNEDNSFYEDVRLQNGVTIRRKKSLGNFLSLVKEYDVLKSYQHLKVYANEDEMSLLCPDRILFEYEDDDFIKNIDIIGQYVYIVSEKEAYSGVEIHEEAVNNLYFVNFSAYTLRDKTSFTYDNQEVFISYDAKEKLFKISRKEMDENDEDVLIEIRGISKAISYPYVLYVLKNLERDTTNLQLTNCTVTKIQRK